MITTIINSRPERDASILGQRAEAEAGDARAVGAGSELKVDELGRGRRVVACDIQAYRPGGSRRHVLRKELVRGLRVHQRE